MKKRVSRIFGHFIICLEEIFAEKQKIRRFIKVTIKYLDMSHYILIYCGSKLIYMKEYENIKLAISESEDLHRHVIDDADVEVILTNDADGVREAIEEAETPTGMEEKHPFAI